MAHVALYRKWRPLTFDDVVEQSHIVTTLKNCVKNNTIGHAYLFCGTRGTGKTTLAKIFSRAVNCLNPIDGNPCNACSNCTGILDGSIIDVVEIDAASNNGVDDVREIREAVMYVPAVTKYKVYIIDEVHMLSTGAFNALLKTLEEPPENVIFILATTEPHKIPATILSRCQRFDFKRITLDGIASRLKTIADDTGVNVEDSAIKLIARLADGGMRDAISLLDQCVSVGKNTITRRDVVEISGIAASETVDLLASAIVGRDVRSALGYIKEAMNEGRDLVPLCAQTIEWFRTLMLVKIGGDATKLADLDDEELRSFTDKAGAMNLDRIVAVIKELSETESRLKWAENQRIAFEVTLVKLCSGNLTEGTDSSLVNPIDTTGGEAISRLEKRIQELENKINRLESAISSGDVKFSSRTKSERAPENKSKISSENNCPPGGGENKADIKPAGNIAGGARFENWPNVVEYVRTLGKMKVYAYLLDTECIIKDKENVLVVVPGDGGLKKVVLSRNESIEAIKEAFNKVTGMDVNISIIEADKNNNVGEAENDQVLEKLKAFASENGIELKVEE